MPALRRNRFERRRAETRQALVRAARQTLAESGGAGASVHAIAERADVGLGSFYNHFTGKPDLFDVAVADALEEYGQAVDERLHGVDDPAERLAGGVRLSVRMAESYPEIMQMLCHSQLGRICGGGGLAARAKRDVEEGMAAGRFTVVDPVIALTVLNGSLLALLELWCNQPGADSDQAAGIMAEMILHMLGLSPDEARDVARRALPATV